MWEFFRDDPKIDKDIEWMVMAQYSTFYYLARTGGIMKSKSLQIKTHSCCCNAPWKI